MAYTRVQNLALAFYAFLVKTEFIKLIWFTLYSYGKKAKQLILWKLMSLRPLKWIMNIIVLLNKSKPFLFSTTLWLFLLIEWTAPFY